MSGHPASRTVAFLDTNALHYLALFVGFVRDTGLDIDDVENGTLSKRMRQEHDPDYKRSLRKGHALVAFVIRDDVQVEYSHFSMVELLCGRIRGAAVMSLAREGAPERMWSKISERQIYERSVRDLPSIKTRLEALPVALNDWNIIFGTRPQAGDVLQLARRIVGFVYMSAPDSVVYAEAVAARADYLVTDDAYLRKAVKRIRDPNGNRQFRSIRQELASLGYEDLPEARSCAER